MSSCCMGCQVFDYTDCMNQITPFKMAQIVAVALLAAVILYFIIRNRRQVGLE